MTVHPGLSSGEGRNHGLPRPVPGKCERLNELLNQPRRYRHIDSNIKRRVPMRVKERTQQRMPIFHVLLQSLSKCDHGHCKSMQGDVIVR